jgi:4-carboxymuconolactone decarboxylase
VSADEITALEGGDLDIFSPDERALIDFATEVAQNVSPSDATLAAMRAHFSDQIVFEVTAIVGYYMMVARFIAVGGVEPDPAPVTTW